MFSTQKHFTNNLHVTQKIKSAFQKLWHVQKCESCICRNVHSAESCICKKVCAADLRILCTTVFRTFADLRICVLCMCRSLRTCVKTFCASCAFVKTFCKSVRICEIVFWAFFTKFANLSKICQNVEKVEISENVPKMSEKSSRVPEWYTSGSWANAFDNTGWQKSPEYALIRIAAGAPDLAKSGQIRPRTAPDGKSSRIWRQGSLLLPRLKSFPELFFPDTRTDLRSVDLFPRRVEFCDRVRHILQMCAHFAKHSLKTAVRANDILHTVHTVHNRNRHTCTTCAHRNTDVHTCAQPRHNSRHKWQRTHRPCVALVGRREVRSVHEQ